MKLAEHAERIRLLIDKAVRNKFGRIGITPKNDAPASGLNDELVAEFNKINEVLETFNRETASKHDAYEKLVEEFTFTLFNRFAALKVMEAHTLHPEIVTQRAQHGGRSYAHNYWLEQNPQYRGAELDGIQHFILDKCTELARDIPLFSAEYPYHLMPTAIELNEIISAFNAVEQDAQLEGNIWQSDDILGWLYESYNTYKKVLHKESGKKTEYDKVSIQSQVYTPRWVVKFLVDNSLGKLYLEMYPGSEIKNKYAIANAPKIKMREPKPLTEIRIIDPATGSGNFLLYAFDLFYDLYLDQIEHYGAAYEEDQIPALILTHNLYGIDIDDRAIQLAQFGLYIKAKRKIRSITIDHFNVVSTDFYLPPYKDVKKLLGAGEQLSADLEKIAIALWDDLQQAYKFGALINLEEKFSVRLHGLTAEFAGKQANVFEEQNLANYETFKQNFFAGLNQAVQSNRAKLGQTFLNSKTEDAITFLKIITQRYDAAVANPPYTDSSDFGPELKKFVDANFKQPHKFNSNLYSVFIKRCFDLTVSDGKFALVHPETFMYIKTFQDVRRFIVDKTIISLFVEWGYLGMFNPTARVDSAMYILEKKAEKGFSRFIKLNDIYEGKRYDLFVSAYEDLISGKPNPRVYTLSQEKLKIIDGWPFIYWISDGFREKFKGETVDQNFIVQRGCETNNNDKYLRFWWENGTKYLPKSKYFLYAKGGPYNKWYGNIWLTLDLRGTNYNEIMQNGNLAGYDYYGQNGITYTGSGSKGPSFRILPSNSAFDVGGSSIFCSKFADIHYALGFFNSVMIRYLLDCLNPTVNVQIFDIKRIPFFDPDPSIKIKVSSAAKRNIFLKREIDKYRITDVDFAVSPLLEQKSIMLQLLAQNYVNFCNLHMSEVLVNEAVIDDCVIKSFNITRQDQLQIELKMGKHIGALPVIKQAADLFKSLITGGNSEVRDLVLEHLNKLEVVEFDEEFTANIKAGFSTLYQSNNDLEEFCIRHQVNPINVWYWFRESKILPTARAEEITLEFLADAFRTILMEDEDGIVPLVPMTGEKQLTDRFEEYCFNKGFTPAQIKQLDGLLGRPLGEYTNHHFFKRLSDHLNLFMYLPKTPFIWHLSSGENRGFEIYIIIYKWNRDSLYKLKSKYLDKRVEGLKDRLLDLLDNKTAAALTEKDLITVQLGEIGSFYKKIEELIEEGYDPKLDDGVAKNIAPLQKKGLLRAEVLKKNQLEKYLNADW